MRKVPPELGEWVLRRTDQPGSKEALSVRVSHRFTAGSARFDEDNLVSDAGLVPLLGLAEQTGLAEIIAGKVSITTPRIKSGSANPAPKLLTAYLAVLPLSERGPLIRRLPLRAFTPHSIIMRDDLEVEIHRTRQRGWSEDHVEFHPESTCCGAVSGWKGVGPRLPALQPQKAHCCCRVAPP